MGPKRLQVHLILLSAACLALLGCSHGAPGAASAGGGGGGSSSSAHASATTDAGSNGGGGSGGSGGDSGQSSGGGGAPIAIPNIIILEGHDVYDLKMKIEQKVQELCGYACVTVVVTNTSATTCLSGYSANPPLVGPGDDPSADYTFKRGTVITLMGGASCGPPTTAPPTTAPPATAPPATAPATIPPTAPPTSPAA
jgi:hypothetical protein